MDEINNWMNFNKPRKTIDVFAGSIKAGSIPATPKKCESQPRLTDIDADILEDDIEQMRNNLEIALKMKKNQEPQVDNDAPIENDFDNVYNTFKFNHYPLNILPIHSVEQEIMRKLQHHTSIVIVGNTGCGKSTQMPQMILNDAYKNKKPCNIVVTQPRRIAARSIAERVSEERGWPLGSVVGYQVGLDKRHVTEDTRLLFCTTGVLLEKIIAAKSLTNFTHIILDEIHERDKDMDFLFILIKILMSKHESNTKIVLMSATIDPHKFSEYFKSFENGRWVKAPIVNVEKKNTYIVRNFFLDDFLKFDLSVLNLSWDRPGISENLYTTTLRVIKGIEPMDTNTEHLPTILIFLPGIFEIGCLYSKLKEANEQSHSKWQLHILHSMVSKEDQLKIFRPTESGTRKIILSTNIAESSITIPDVKYVIDFCLIKYLKTHPSRNYTSLEMDWASHNNCNQRSGRAGRVMDGRCYRMIPRRIYDTYLPESATPEMLLCPLENIVLKTKQFDMGPPHVILGLAMDRPNLTDVATTVLILKELGALTPKEDDVNCRIDGDLTFLGRIMIALPIDVRASRLIALGYCFSVMDEAIIMAAALTTKSVFRISFDKDLRAYSHRLEWSNGSGSDLFAAYHAYHIWQMKCNPNDRLEEIRFCSQFYLDMRSLHECHQLVAELKQRLDKLGLYNLKKDKVRWTDKEKSIILKVIISGAFYPNFFATSPSNSTVEHEVFRILNGRDPNKTVFFTGFRPDHIRELYVDSIKKFFVKSVVDENRINDIHVSFDRFSEKVFVSFGNDAKSIEKNPLHWNMRSFIPGRTQPEVYKALKMSQMRMPLDISVYRVEAEKRLAVDCGLGIISKNDRFVPKIEEREDIRHICIPNPLVKEVEGTITYIENCSKFWFQSVNEAETVNGYTNDLNDPTNAIIEPCAEDADINKNTIIVVRDKKDKKFYRARLQDWIPIFGSTKRKCIVKFIDFGHTQECFVSDLYCFLEKNPASYMPARCFECCLAEIQPSSLNKNGGNSWEYEAIDLFRKSTRGKRVTAKIYSTVNAVTNVFIMIGNQNINDLLLKNNFGEFCEENYLSKDNHWRRNEEREFMKTKSNDEVMEYNYDQYFPIIEAESIPLPNNQEYYRKVHLIGPRSPLESKMHPILNVGLSKATGIDPNSVNSVLLIPFQQDSNVRYMAAAHSKRNNEGHITINETTLLPNIRGFGPLMALIFSPSTDLKRDQTKSRYISILTGLGYSREDKVSLFPEHDALFHLDFELTNDDISSINQIRYCISTLLYAPGTENKNETLRDMNRIQVMEKLKKVTLHLLLTDRKPIEVNNNSHTWNDYDAEDFIPPVDIDVYKLILPLHGTLKLYPMNNDAKKQLRFHCRELHKMIFDDFSRPITCKLCATEIASSTILRVHLLSYLHKQKEKSIGFTK